MLAGLGLLAAWSLLATELPRHVAIPLALACCGYGGWLARRELAQPARSLIVPHGDGIATIDDQPMNDLQVAWRGPLAFLCWRDNRHRLRRLQLWPDQVGPRSRRELRLAMAARPPAPSRRSMAP